MGLRSAMSLNEACALHELWLTALRAGDTETPENAIHR